MDKNTDGQREGDYFFSGIPMRDLDQARRDFEKASKEEGAMIIGDMLAEAMAALGELKEVGEQHPEIQDALARLATGIALPLHMLGYEIRVTD